MPRTDGASPRAAEKSSKELPQVVWRVPKKTREVVSRILVSALFVICTGALYLLGCPTSPTWPVHRASFNSWSFRGLSLCSALGHEREQYDVSMESMDWTLD